MFPLILTVLENTKALIKLISLRRDTTFVFSIFVTKTF